MKIFSNKLGTNLWYDLLKELKGYTIGSASVNLIDQKRLKAVGVKVAAFIFVVDTLVKEIHPANFAFKC